MIKEQSDNDFSNFYKFVLIMIENYNYLIILTLWTKFTIYWFNGYLKDEINSRFGDIKNFHNAFRFIENPWTVTYKIEIKIFNCNVGFLKMS